MVSLNFQDDCDFYDFGTGIDAAIQLFDLDGNILIENEIEDLNQVNGAEDNVPFSLGSNADCCNNGYSQTLGIFPIEETLFSFIVEIFDNDGGCCDGYQSNTDDNYGIETITIDIINDVTGTIDVGSCISFNYELDVTPIFEFGRANFEEVVCPDFSIEFNNIEYNMDYPAGKDTIWGGSANGCDSFINVQLEFFPSFSALINGDPKICYDESDVLALSEVYESYNWNTGEDTQVIEINGPGIYTVTVTDASGCTAEDFLLVEYHPDFFPSIVGPTAFCAGDAIELMVEGEFVSYEWSNGETTNAINVSTGGDYVVTVVNDAGCASQNIFTVDEVLLAAPSMLGDEIVCFGSSTDIGTGDDYAGYQWSTGESAATITVDVSGVYSVTVNDALGCESENEFEVLVKEEYIVIDTFYTCSPDFVGQDDMSVLSPDGCTGRRIESTILYEAIPSFEATPNQVIISGMTVELSVVLDNPEDIVIDWYDGADSLICADCSGVEVSPNPTEVFYALIQYHPECELREEIEVTVKSDKRIYVPNIFSPSLETNKTFQIYGPDIASIEAFNVYDRWGNQVMENKGLDAFWDGRRNGLVLENGVYVYLIELTYIDGTNNTLVGDITLIE